MKETLTFERLNKHSEGVSEQCKTKLLEFRSMLDKLEPSKKTHYGNLDESFSNPVYDFVHNSLKEFGFVNGEPEINKTNQDAMLFWALYGNIECFDYSPYFHDVKEDESVARHHSSAYVRCEVLKREIDNFIQAKGWT